MNFTIDYGAVIVAGCGAAISGIVIVIAIKTDMTWLKQSMARLEHDIAVAHKRIDALLARDRSSRQDDKVDA